MKNKRTRLTALAFVLVLAAALALALDAFAGAKPQGKYKPGPPPTNANSVGPTRDRRVSSCKYKPGPPPTNANAAREGGAGENRGGEIVKNKNGNENVGIPDSACRRRCRADYRRCLRGGKSRRSCESRLRNCYRHCPQ